MNNVIFRKLTVADTWQPLSGPSLVGTVTVSAAPTNSGNVLFRTAAEPDHEVPWLPGEWHALHRVDLAQIEVRGVPGDGVAVVGGTW